MDISVIIVSWNTKDLLRKALASIYKGKSNLRLEIIVVDNNSRDGTVAMIHREFPEVVVIANTINHGFAKANNQAIAVSKGEYILALNPDTEIIDDCLPHGVQLMRRNPEIGILGARHLNPDKSLQPSVRRLPTAINVTVIFFKLHKLFPGLLHKYLARDFSYKNGESVEQVAGSFMLMSRDMLEQIGLFDEKFFIWFEEVDLCRRARKAGWMVWFEPSMRIIHHGGQSFSQVNGFKKQLLFFRSALQFLRSR